MSNQPLYYNTKPVSKLVNPINILPSLIQKQEERKKGKSFIVNAATFMEANAGKEKKIKKDDSKKLYRTKMCPYGRECKKRFTCTFAHNEQELRRPYMKRKNPCLLYQRGQCSLGSACRDYHGNIDLQKNYKYKEKVCEDFLKGSCLKGNVCIFLHEEPKSEGIEDQIEEINEGQHKSNENEFEIENENQEIVESEENENANDERKEETVNKEIKDEKEENKLVEEDGDFLDFANGDIVLSFD